MSISKIWICENQLNKSYDENQITNYLKIKDNNLILTIHVKPKSKMNKILNSNIEFIVHTTALPELGKANKMIINQLSEYLNISKSSISIEAGQKSNTKTILISCKNENNMDSIIKQFRN